MRCAFRMPSPEELHVTVELAYGTVRVASDREQHAFDRRSVQFSAQLVAQCSWCLHRLPYMMFISIVGDPSHGRRRNQNAYALPVGTVGEALVHIFPTVSLPKVSDIRFRSLHGKECACATAWLGGVGKPGGVKAIVGDDEAIANMAGFGGTDCLTEMNIRTSELQVRLLA